MNKIIETISTNRLSVKHFILVAFFNIIDVLIFLSDLRSLQLTNIIVGA